MNWAHFFQALAAILFFASLIGAVIVNEGAHRQRRERGRAEQFDSDPYDLESARVAMERTARRFAISPLPEQSLGHTRLGMQKAPAPSDRPGA